MHQPIRVVVLSMPMLLDYFSRLLSPNLAFLAVSLHPVVNMLQRVDDFR